MLTIIIVRHGEVFNPNHVVYADLPGFDLSATGVRQAHLVGEYLANRSLDIIVSSPLARAKHTATAIARHHATGVTIDSRLIETRMYPDWTARTWDDIAEHFPAQFSGYLEDATQLRDVSESVGQVLTRVSASVTDAIAQGHKTIVVVGHQDPSQTLRLGLVGRPLSELRYDPPGHASATTITSLDGVSFNEISVWNPEIIGLSRQANG